MTGKHPKGHVEFHPPAVKLVADLPGDGQLPEEADTIGQGAASTEDCLVVTKKAHAEKAES